MRSEYAGPRATLSLIAIMVIVFVLQILIRGITANFSFIPAYAFQEPWTFITSIFLHFDINHIFFNMFALFMFGIVLESRIGYKKFLFVFFAAGIVGNFGYMLTASDSQIPAIGASGAVYGIMGTTAALMPFAIIWIGAPMPMIVAAFIWGISEFLGLFVPSNIARGAHLLGLAFGLAYGIYLRKVHNRKMTRGTFL